MTGSATQPDDSLSRRAGEQAREVQRVTVWGLIVNLALAAVKFVVGVLGNSQALVADGVHSLSDSSTDVAILIGARFWSAPADADHPHGHGRIEMLITCLIGLALAGVGAGLAYRALFSMSTPDEQTPPPGYSALVVACLAIVAKEVLYRWTAEVGRRVKSSALLANAWHHRSDALSSLPVAIAVLGTKIQPAWVFLDQVGAVIVSVLILHVAFTITFRALRQLTDAAAGEQEKRTIDLLASATEGVQTIHKIRTRHIGPGLQVDLHVMVDPQLSVREGHAIAGAVKRRLLGDGPDVVDVLVHIEPFEAKS